MQLAKSGQRYKKIFIYANILLFFLEKTILPHHARGYCLILPYFYAGFMLSPNMAPPASYDCRVYNTKICWFLNIKKVVINDWFIATYKKWNFVLSRITCKRLTWAIQGTYMRQARDTYFSFQFCQLSSNEADGVTQGVCDLPFFTMDCWRTLVVM